MPFQFTCEQCGKSFERKQRHPSGGSPRFCSRDCRYAPRPGIAQEDGTVLVPLTQGKFAIVDAVDAEDVLRHLWCYTPESGANRRRQNNERPGPPIIRMSRQILGITDERLVDHANGNRLDNRRRNLRPATPLQNTTNSKRPVTNRSGYKGVYRRYRRWLARIKIEGHMLFLGSFETPEEAARAYDKAALAEWGAFARTNFVHAEIPSANEA